MCRRISISRSPQKGRVMNTNELRVSHWKIMRFLRTQYKKTSQVPTIYETCEANEVELEEMESLFPDGYHRGAVKIAGLKQR